MNTVTVPASEVEVLEQEPDVFVVLKEVCHVRYVRRLWAVYVFLIALIIVGITLRRSPTMP